MSNIKFAKISALGNIILVVDDPFEIASSSLLASLAAHETTSYEQVMVLQKMLDNRPDFRALKIFNNDGSKAGACGNGMRAVALYLYHNNAIELGYYEINDSILRSFYDADDLIWVDMGPPIFDSLPLKLNYNFLDLTCVPISGLGDGFILSMGNPHMVFFTQNFFDEETVVRAANYLKSLNIFADGCNYSFAHIHTNSEIWLRTFERGVGITQACGSAACATAVAAIVRQYCDNLLRVRMMGGDLTIHWQPGKGVIMGGGAKFIRQGLVDSENFTLKDLQEGSSLYKPTIYQPLDLAEFDK